MRARSSLRAPACRARGICALSERQQGRAHSCRCISRPGREASTMLAADSWLRARLSGATCAPRQTCPPGNLFHLPECGIHFTWVWRPRARPTGNHVSCWLVTAFERSRASFAQAYAFPPNRVVFTSAWLGWLCFAFPQTSFAFKLTWPGELGRSTPPLVTLPRTPALRVSSGRAKLLGSSRVAVGVDSS